MMAEREQITFKLCRPYNDSSISENAVTFLQLPLPDEVQNHFIKLPATLPPPRAMEF